jgi:alkylhydroperoxidase family enzyme
MIGIPTGPTWTAINSFLQKQILWPTVLTCAVFTAVVHSASGQDARFPVPSSLEAWIQLPEAVQGAGEELPSWARVLSSSLPNTTARMLELDWLQRDNSPLEASLRGQLRWTVAKANRCDYSLAYAAADLKRAGWTEEQIAKLDKAGSGASEAVNAALDFAGKLTLAGDTVTDEEVAELRESFGEKQLVAIVLLVAHASFQDRLFLSLGLKLDANEPLPPLAVRFARGPQTQAATVPKRERPAQSSPIEVEEKVTDAPWLSLDVPALKQKMQAQQQRPGRIRVPTWEEISKDAPPEIRNRPPVKIRWSLVCRGYQPALAEGWGACLGTFESESGQDRVFEESLFWVITREINCFY